MAAPGRPVVVGFDFDSTVTEGDTCAVLVDAAVADFRRVSIRGAVAPSPTEVESEWELLVEGYGAERERFAAGTAGIGDIATYNEALREFEQAMNRKFERSRLLKGLTLKTMEECARKVQLQAGSRALLTDLLAANKAARAGQRHGTHVHVVSCSWSGRFIRAALDTPASLKEELAVHSNELAWVTQKSHKGDEGRELCIDGRIHFTMEDPIAKAECFSAIVEQMQGEADAQVLSVFVGDSSGDMSAMLAADVGIFMGKKGEVAELCERFGIELVDYNASSQPKASLSDLANRKNAKTTPNGILFRCSAWSDIRKLFEREGVLADEEKRAPARVLCISGSDSGGGAGNQADLKVCSVFGAYGTSVLAALTAQNTHGVHDIDVVHPAFVEAQLESVLCDIGTDAAKVGMLATTANVCAVASQLQKHAVQNIVVDPVLVASAGDSLTKEDIVQALISELFPLAAVVTPNIPEAEALLGWMPGRINSIATQTLAARELKKLGPGCVLVKGGHARGSADTCVDILFDGERIFELSSSRIRTRCVHGTGCAMSTAIACGLASGLSPVQACKCSKIYLTSVLSNSRFLCMGTGPQKPMHHHPILKTLASHTLKDASRYLLYAITDSPINEKHGRTLASAVRSAVLGGATLIQIREKKKLPTSEMCAQAREVVRVCKRFGVPVIVNDRADVCLASGADGVHLGQEDLSITDARAMLGPLKLIGASARDVDQALEAQANGADYIGAGGCFPTGTKQDNVTIGLDVVAKIRKAVDVPVVAIGGIALDNAASVMEGTGVAGVAVVSAAFDADDPRVACQKLRAVLSNSCRASSNA